MASGERLRQWPGNKISVSAGRPRRQNKSEVASRDTRTDEVTFEKLRTDRKLVKADEFNLHEIIDNRPKALPFASGRTNNNNVARPSNKNSIKLEGRSSKKGIISPEFPANESRASTRIRPKPLLVPLATGRNNVTLATGKMAAARKASQKDERKTPGPKLSSEKQIPFRGGQGRQVQKTNKQRDVVLSKSAISPRNYTVKPIIPAQTAELIDVARAMHRDKFAARVKKLFDPEREAAIQAIETGIYIGWRCLGNNYDCIRVSTNSKCFCGHLQVEHAAFSERRRQNLECQAPACRCKQFAFIPSRPAEIGEWWLQKRPGFDVSKWRAKCRCKHTHEEHDPNANRKCKVRGCPCFAFDSNFLCAACDKHWEAHETCFDDLDSRRAKELPYGEEYLPFHELPQLRNIVLTGNEDNDSPYNALVNGPYAIPRQQPTELALRLQGNKRT